MSNFYNTSIPTPSNKNTITDIAVKFGIRDFLLLKNLSPVYPQISTSLNGSPKIGEPVLDTMVNNGSNNIPFGLPLETEGIFRWEINTLPNTYKNSSSNAGSLKEINYIEKDIGLFPNTTPIGYGNDYPTSSNDFINEFGILAKTKEGNYLKKTTIKNLYLDVSKQIDIADFITLETAPITQQINGYLDVYGGLNTGNGSIAQPINVVGSILNGQGLGLAKGGIVTNFDFRASLVGRVLGSTGLINDTKLGLIGSQQLALALANNAAFNIEQSILGSLNIQDNILSLVKNGSLSGFRQNYQITVPTSDQGRALDYTSRILGFTLPKSYLKDGGSIFLSESNTSNIERANSMILNTGKGQITALISNVNSNLIGTTQYDNPDNSIFRSGYAPGYTNNLGEKAINPQTYAYGDANGIIYNFLTRTNGVIPEINYNGSDMILKYGFTGPEDLVDSNNPYVGSTIRKPTFTWGSNIGNGVNNIEGANQYISDNKKKSLLAKTQLLFNDVGMKNIISTKGQMNVKASQIQTAVVGNGISRGSAVLSSKNFNDLGQYNGSSASTAEETYCRSWTTLSRYEKVKNLVRSSGLSTIYPYRNQINNSVLSEFGIPKISPYDSDGKTDPKKFMFSIENLAWADNIDNLLPCETGSGDLITGLKGRIMWFPPYDITFNENITTNWESNNFIGRGESVYTYNNTERSGTLSFKIVVDHPTYVNSFRGSNGPDDHYVASFFAGCVEPNSKFSDKLTVSELSSLSSQNLTKSQIKHIGKQIEPQDINIYFPNDVAIYNKTYEDGLSGSTSSNIIDYSVNPSGEGFGLGPTPGTFHGGITINWNDNYDFGLNGINNLINIDGQSYSGFSDSNLINGLNTYLNTKCTACKIQVNGYASSQGKESINKDLALARANNIITYLKTVLFTSLDEVEKNKRFKKPNANVLSGTGCNPKTGSPTDSKNCKEDRRVVISFEFDPSLLPKEETSGDYVVPKQQSSVNQKILNRFYNECDYFEELTDQDSFIFDKFREKIKYFHPAFHSTTPEGLNSRLTFLHQCTRQGATLEQQGANNLAFGRPPVCILRIGDFYNTKIIIENMGIDFEPLVWDLNPEGVGVQPMIANISLSFKFIGGSTLSGPINKLQNALSFNYYANTQVYDPRADYIVKDENRNRLVKTVNGKELAVVGYNIKNGVKNANDLVEVVYTNSEIKDNTGLIDQIKTRNLSDNTSQDDITLPSDPTITGFQIIENLTVKENTRWKINIRFNLENGTGNYNSDANTLLNSDSYSLSITRLDGTEFYEIKINSNLIMQEFIDPSNSNNYFIIPIKGVNGRIDGVTDNLGKETFFITLLKNNVKIQQKDIKLT